MAKDKKINWTVVILIILCIVIIIYYTIKYVIKLEERERLNAKLKEFISQKIEIENLKKYLDRNFKIVYNSIKALFLVGIITLIIIVYKNLPSDKNSIFDFASSITDVFGSLGILLILICLLIEENPLDVFKIRSILYNKLHNAIYGKHQETLDKLPNIEKDIEDIKKDLENLN